LFDYTHFDFYSFLLWTSQNKQRQLTVESIDRLNSYVAWYRHAATGCGSVWSRYSYSGGSETLFFDAGHGCLQRLRQLNVSYDQIAALFLTHLHSDHVVGLPDLWLTGWLVSQRSNPMNIYGPTGTNPMVSNLEKPLHLISKSVLQTIKSQGKAANF
jgi:ribonuclease BN (tRNA processing enzyme)